jgi:hypothetical protein
MSKHRLVLVLVLLLGALVAVPGAAPQTQSAQIIPGAAAGTWMVKQGATLVDPGTGQPITDVPYELFAGDETLLLDPNGGVIDVSSLLHPSSKGSTYTIDLGPGMVVGLTMPFNASVGVGTWRTGRDSVTIRVRKLILDDENKAMGYAEVFREVTRLTQTEIEGITRVLFMDLNGGALSWPAITLNGDPLPPITGFLGPFKGTRMPGMR